MFPYKDENPTLRTPVVTFFLIGVNIAAWLLFQGAGQDPLLADSVCRLGLIPGHVFGHIPPGQQVQIGPDAYCAASAIPGWATVLTSMFMHGGWLHLLGNMWFLWVFGNNIEDSTGRARFLLFYLLCGVAAALAQGLSSPESPIPMVGASGAISGVMGAYVVLYPKVRVHMLIFLGFFVTTIRVPAVLMLGYWFLLQLIGGLPGVDKDIGGTAFLAHVGGFVAGMALVFVFRSRRLMEARNVKVWA